MGQDAIGDRFLVLLEHLPFLFEDRSTRVGRRKLLVVLIDQHPCHQGEFLLGDQEEGSQAHLGLGQAVQGIGLGQPFQKRQAGQRVWVHRRRQ